MAMQVGSDDASEEVMGEINTTPLVDVMLVLLIIFLIAIPVVTTSIPVTLPKERLEARHAKPETIIISVSQSGGLFIYDRQVAGVDALAEQLRSFGVRHPIDGVTHGRRGRMKDGPDESDGVRLKSNVSPGRATSLDGMAWGSVLTET